MITNLLQGSGVQLGASALNKAEALARLADLQEKNGNLKEKAGYLAGLKAREEQGTTAVGNGVAVPHAKGAWVAKAGLCVLRLENPVDWGEGKEADLIFAIAAPEEGNAHLEILSRLAALLMDRELAEALRRAKDSGEFLQTLALFEERRFESKDKEPDRAGTLVLAVTACPTGIAHTYMAAEALEKAGKALGVQVKAETQGAGGPKNLLTLEDIRRCKGVIVAADREVDLTRFEGVPLLRVPVRDGIHRAQALVEKICEGQVPVYGEKRERPPEQGSGIYRVLMNGVSHMLPFVIGGGILMAAAFLMDDPALGAETFGKNTPLAAWCSSAGESAFGLMLPVLAGFTAAAIGERGALMPGFVGGVMAVNGTGFAGKSGVSSGFLGALLAGLAAGWLVKGLQKIFAGLPRSLAGIREILLVPVLGLALTAAFMGFVNPVMGRVNSGLYGGLEALAGKSLVLLGAVLGGMMAVDMGGPFNKAAYVFGTSTLAAAAGQPSPMMAAVMAGGMVPPLGIAAAATVLPRLFTEEERKAAPANYVMGLCFITEGAIPFAAADPVRVLPACMAGAALAGGMAAGLGCGLPAPHGGVFVLPLMRGTGEFVLAVSAGAVLTAVLLGILKHRKAG